jgi:hypothetical protein
MERKEAVQFLLDMTADFINEIEADFHDCCPTVTFEQATKLAIEQYHFITNKTKKQLIVGRVDTTKVAFSLQDNETVAILQGSEEFAEMINLDYIDEIETK